MSGRRMSPMWPSRFPILSSSNLASLPNLAPRPALHPLDALESGEGLLLIVTLGGKESACSDASLLQSASPVRHDPLQFFQPHGERPHVSFLERFVEALNQRHHRLESQVC